MSSVCKACGQPIVWANTPGGKKLALDPEPCPLKGKVWLDPVTQTATSLRRWDREQAQKRGDPLYVKHWSHCKTVVSLQRKGKWG